MPGTALVASSSGREHWQVPSGLACHDLQGLAWLLWSRQSWGDPEEGSSKLAAVPTVFREQRALSWGGNPNLQGGLGGGYTALTTSSARAPGPAALVLTF